MARRKTVEPPCDPTTVATGDLVTARMYPCRTYYNKPVLITGTVREVVEGWLSLKSAGGYHTVRLIDIVRIKEVRDV